MAIPVAAGVAVARALAGWVGQRKSNPGVYTMGNQKYIRKVAEGTAPITDAWLNNRAARDLPKLEKLLQVQPGTLNPGIPSTADVLSASPSMPGGAWATPQGVQPATSQLPPMWYGANAPSGGGKRRRKSKAKSARRGGTRRKRGGAKLKFGSPKWRKKYLGKKNAKVKRAKRAVAA